MATDQRIFCDTNYLLDIFDAEREHHADAIALLWYCAENSNTTELMASVSSFKDAYYILQRLYKDEARARESIGRIMGKFVEPVDMLARYGAEALASDEPDFEDGLIRACAEHESATTIITRDAEAFASSDIPAMPAAEFLSNAGFGYEVIDW